MTEYTRRELRTITSRALRKLADDRHAEARDRSMALAALAELNSEPKPDLRESYVCRFQVQPGLWLTVDASHNIMLEVRTPDEAELLAAYALSDVAEFRHLLDRAYSARDEAGRGRIPAALARAHRAPDGQLCCIDHPRPGGVCGQDDTREESRASILRDLSPAVHDQATADMAESIANEFSQLGITGVEFADPEPDAPDVRYDASAGIRPPRRGKVRGVAYAVEPGGAMEIWHCEHDHAPGMRDCRQLAGAQRAEAAECAGAWLAERIAAGQLADLPVVRVQ